MVEAEALDRFLDAYDEVTGQRFVVLNAGERPDFICARPSGEKVGVELTRPHHDYEMVRWDRILAPGRRMRDYDLLPAIHSVLEKKMLKLQTKGWRLPEATILVVQLVDYTFSSWNWLSDDSLCGDFAPTGFAEIWLADHTTWEAYRRIRLIGLYPERNWGPHRQQSLKGKPYG